jgi:hypothetical protein
MTASRRIVAVAAAIMAVFWSQFLWVRATNFGGWDEWLVIDLTSRGIVGLPYQNRPFSLAFNLVGSLLSPHGLWGFYLVHGSYLAGSGVLVYLLVRRVAPNEERLARLAGMLGPIWAPLDDIRLDVVLTASYAGVTFASLVALFLLVESYKRRSLPALIAVAVFGGLVTRCVEATAGLMVAGPLLLLALPERNARAWREAALVWSAAVGAAAVLSAWPLLFAPPGGSYQAQGLGFDPHPLRVAGRMARQLAFHLLPLATPDWREALDPAVPLSVAVFLGAFWLLERRGAAPEPGSSAALTPGLVGLLGAVLGYAVLTLSPAIRTPARAQILSAPGIGLFLAAAICWIGARVRRPRLVAGLLGTWVVAVGTARIVAMQRQWDAKSYWTAQRLMLASLVEQAPDLHPGTFVILLDGASVFPATFTFHHALDYLYDGRAKGVSWGAEPFLYPCVFSSEGVLSVPASSIRVPWDEPARLYPYRQLLVLRAERGGGVRVLDAWPGGSLPALPEGAAYEPRRRIRGAAPRPPLRILGSRRLG